MNNGVWKGLENKTAERADKYSAVWIMCGPVLFNRMPQKIIGDEGEVPVAVPDPWEIMIVG